VSPTSPAEREFLALVDELVAGASITNGALEIRETAFRKLCAWRERRVPTRVRERVAPTAFEKRPIRRSDLGPAPCSPPNTVNSPPSVSSTLDNAP